MRGLNEDHPIHRDVYCFAICRYRLRVVGAEKDVDGGYVMSDVARPIDKPTRGRDPLSEAIKHWRPQWFAKDGDRIAPISPAPPTSDLHELLDRLEVKVALLVANRSLI